jgi:predicted transcriptional regulator
MAKSEEPDFQMPVPVKYDEDEATLAAIDRGIQDTKEGRTVSLKEVRKLLPKWITDSASRKNR